MDCFPNNWEKPQHEKIDQEHYARSGVIKHTQSPIVTGASVIAFKYRDGVMMAADTLGSYGGLARFRSIERLIRVGEYTLIGSSGDISDLQYTKHILDTLMTKEYYTNDGHVLGTAQIYEYLTQVMYHRRTELNPLWNSHVVGGFQNGESFLGSVDLLGVTYKASTIATGLGGYLALPFLRKAVCGHEDTLTEAEAIEIVNNCMRLLFYRDARSLNKFQRAKVTAQGVEITAPQTLDTDWSFGHMNWNPLD